MASFGWKMFVEDSRWNGAKKLYITNTPFPGRYRQVVTAFAVETLEPGSVVDKPTLQQNYEEGVDRIGDVDGFLQAALDAAWEIGMRPTGFADHTHELSAVRYHLEDMRALAKVPERRK